MPALKNTKHEAFAANLAKGMTQLNAYTTAGFAKGAVKSRKASASRLAANVNVKNRVNELTAKRADAVQRKPSYDPLAMFQRLSELVDQAEAMGDIKTAGAMQMFIIECFGYRDSPTLTHEDIRGIKGTTSEGERDDAARNERVIRFPKTLAELKKQTGLN